MRAEAVPLWLGNAVQESRPVVVAVVAVVACTTRVHLPSCIPYCRHYYYYHLTSLSPYRGLHSLSMPACVLCAVCSLPVGHSWVVRSADLTLSAQRTTPAN